MAVKGGDAAYSALATTLPVGAETIAVALAPVDVPADSVRAMVTFICSFASGVGVTGVTPIIRRGTAVTDPFITVNAAIPVTASSFGVTAVSVIDVLAGAATVGYVGTMTAVGGGLTNKNAQIFVLFF